MGDSSFTVRDVLSPNAPTVAATDTLRDACRRMNSGGQGSAPVIDEDGRCVGVLAAWDVVRAIARDADLEDTLAVDVVGPEKAVHPDDDLEEAIGSNHAGIVIPVVEDGRYVGVVGPGDAEAARQLSLVLGPAAAHVDRTVAPGDKMHGRIRGPYLLAGISALMLIRAAMSQAEINGHPHSILDLPCGHGRVTRILRAAFPATTLIACDLERDGVDFCAETFGAEPLYSDTDPARVQLDQQVDVTWVGSLLTHIAFERWDGFMDLFARSLRPGGVLVFTTFDHPRLPSLGVMNLPDAERLLRDRVERGVGFQPYVGQDDYGVALVGPEHVRQAIEAEERFEVLSHRPLSWFPPTPIQDTWICRRLGTN